MTGLAYRNGGGGREWMAEAACRGQDPRWFTDPEHPQDTRQALATCATCRVRATCLATALSHPAESDAGIWGGTTEETRRRIRTGRLSIEQALSTDPPAQAKVQRQPLNGTVADQQPPPAVAPIPRVAAPEITVARDANGDYVSADGRVIIFRIHGQPPWMLMIDRRCVARTVTEARRVAWTTLHSDRVAVVTGPENAHVQPPAGPARRR